MTDPASFFPTLPAKTGKKITAAFDGGAITSNAGVLLLARAETSLRIADRLAALIPDHRDPTRVRRPSRHPARPFSGDRGGVCGRR
jgi:hypothetical protein